MAVLTVRAMEGQALPPVQEEERSEYVKQVIAMKRLTAVVNVKT
jgi:hypothetical protein